jgi:hypothetical protein
VRRAIGPLCQRRPTVALATRLKSAAARISLRLWHGTARPRKAEEGGSLVRRARRAIRLGIPSVTSGHGAADARDGLLRGIHQLAALEGHKVRKAADGAPWRRWPTPPLALVGAEDILGGRSDAHAVPVRKGEEVAL